jgi:hypothetical protein
MYSVTATSIVRLAYIVTIDYHNDFSFHSVPSTFLAAIEPPETIICVSLPMIYSFLARVWPCRKSRHSSSPPARTSYLHVYSPSFRRCSDRKRRSFTPLDMSLRDPFDLNKTHGSERMVMVSADKRGWTHRTLGSRTKSIDRDAEFSSGSETVLVESLPKLSNEQSGGIIVLQDFTVSVSQRE